MANVLGLSFFFHDSAASLVMDGRIVAAVAEERLCRRKHTNEFPQLAIEYCLEQSGLTSINDIDAIVFYEKPITKLFRVLETCIDTWPKSVAPFTQNLPYFLKSKINIRKVIKDKYPNYRGHILFNQHHLSHAASAFYPSPFEEAAIITLDGVGEWDTTSIGFGSQNKIRIDRTIKFPHSVGLLYSALTAYLGFRVNDGEWKVMGLAPYGSPAYVKEFSKLVLFRDDGSFSLNMDFFSHHWSNKTTFQADKWESLFGFPPRDHATDEIDSKYEDLARSGQLVVEELICRVAREAKKQYKTENLVIAGGVGLNSCANWRIQQEGIFKNVWIQPAAGDDGAALGAALYVDHQLEDSPRQEMKDVYLGPEFSPEQVQEFLDSRDIPYRRLSDDQLVEQAVESIRAGKVIGWFQGRMEFGPRSLGNRSIIASACDESMKAKINSKIKFREYFRPFAPAIPLESVHEYFDVEPNTELPFMLKIPQVRKSARDLLPAITHEDGTGRVQTVTEDANPLYYRILKSLGAHGDPPVVVNTSFNVRGEPIVCTPYDAYACFTSTGIDALFLGNFLIDQKPEDVINFDAQFAKSDQLEAHLGDSNEQKVLDQVSDRSEATIIDTRDPKQVLSFYKSLPFNFYSNATEASLNIMRRNQIREYPDLSKILEKDGGAHVLDVGCGAGWFSNSCAHYYKHKVTGLDFNPVAVEQAKSVAILMNDPERIQFQVGDIFEINFEERFDVINSLGVLHHTKDCHEAIRKSLRFLKPGGYFHVGLYHDYSRRPFLDYFKEMQSRDASVEEMFQEFSLLEFPTRDETHLYSWFRDQVLHPNETQHTFEEISELLESEGLIVESTSINGFKPVTSRSAVIAAEKLHTKRAIAKLKAKKYIPGFFTVLARLPSDHG